MIRDQEERDKARLELGCNVVVEAGAGTGKTTLLTDRILFTLLAGGPEGRGVPIENVVALTFTNKAAGEIKARLSGALLDILNAGELPDMKRREAAVERLRQAKARFQLGEQAVRRAALLAIENMDRSAIGTIHHFAAGLLRRYPVEARVDPRFEIDADDESGQDELFESEWALWLDRELGQAGARRERWLSVLRLASLEDIRGVARALCGEGIGADAARPSPRIAKRLHALADRVREMSRLEGKPGPRVAENLSRLPDHLEKAAAAMTSPIQLPEELSHGAFGGGKEGSSRWPDPVRVDYQRALTAANGTSAQSESLVREVTALVAPFARDFQEHYARVGWVSNDGLLAKALALVRGHADVRSEIKDEIGALLIDEFQDTDPLQGELLILLAESSNHHADDWRDVRLESGKLFVVGDPKQSIYRFRGADIRAYSRFTALMIEQGALSCRLQTSFRSRAGLVAPVNAVFSKLMPGEGELQPGYLEIFPRPDDASAEKSPPVELVLAGDPHDPDSSPNADESRGREAAWIARWISENCAPAGSSRKTRRRLADVALLVRSTTALGVYIQALKDAEIAYVVESDKHFFEAQEILDAINLLSVLDDPHDDISLAGLLRSPLAALSDAELYVLRSAGRLDLSRDAPPGAALSARARKRVSRFYGLLRGLHTQAGGMPLGEFVRRSLSMTFLAELSAASYSGSQTASNIEKFARLAEQAGEGRGSTLKEFVAGMRRSIASAQDEGESPLADDHLDAVRILTIHKAKGLEFPVVIVPNMGAPPRSGGKRDLRRDWSSGAIGLHLPGAKAQDAAATILGLDEEEIETYQRVRTLYVAMTRAKEKLILLGAAKAGASASFSGMLAQASAWVAQGHRPKELKLGGVVLPVSYMTEEKHPVAVSSREKKRDKIDPGELAKLWMARLKECDRLSEPIFMNPTDQAQEAAKASWRSSRLDEESAPSRQRQDSSQAALIGDICHKVLERWDYSRSGDIKPMLSDACRALARTHPRADWNALEDEAKNILKAFLKSPAAKDLANCEILGRELPFVYPMEKRLMRGSIDLLYRQDGALWVVDYKTGEPPAKKSSSALERYHAQGMAYVRAIEAAGWGKARFKLLFLRTGEALEFKARA